LLHVAFAMLASITAPNGAVGITEVENAFFKDLGVVFLMVLNLLFPRV
jgi:hypothetical protein